MDRRTLITRGLAVLGAVGAVASIVALYPYLFSNAPTLKAEVVPTGFVLPPGMSEEFKALRSLGDENYLKNNLKFDNLPSDLFRDTQRAALAREVILNDVASYLRFHLPDDLPRPYSLLGGFWEVSIRNDGDKVARSVIIKITYALYFCQKREGEKAECKNATELMRIGDLQPQESIAIEVWTESEPRGFQYDLVRLTFSEGVGSVKILAPASPFWRWMDQHWLFAVIEGALMILMVGILAGAWLQQAKRIRDANQGHEPKSGKEQPGRITA